jgi:hypothetical protein
MSTNVKLSDLANKHAPIHMVATPVSVMLVILNLALNVS